MKKSYIVGHDCFSFRADRFDTLEGAKARMDNLVEWFEGYERKIDITLYENIEIVHNEPKAASIQAVEVNR